MSDINKKRDRLLKLLSNVDFTNDVEITVVGHGSLSVKSTNLIRLLIQEIELIRPGAEQEGVTDNE